MFYDNGGVLSAWARRLFMDLVDQMDLMDKMGAPRYTPRVCLPQSGLARAKMCQWGMQAVPTGIQGGVRGTV